MALGQTEQPLRSAQPSTGYQGSTASHDTIDIPPKQQRSPRRVPTSQCQSTRALRACYYHGISHVVQGPGKGPLRVERTDRVCEPGAQNVSSRSHGNKAIEGAFRRGTIRTKSLDVFPPWAGLPLDAGMVVSASAAALAARCARSRRAIFRRWFAVIRVFRGF